VLPFDRNESYTYREKKLRYRPNPVASDLGTKGYKKDDEKKKEQSYSLTYNHYILKQK
jgi:FPC/CPF motif-containing protein YcgG